jgi:L-asparaginase
MKKILILNTGGTFNKIYNPLNGTLEIDKNTSALTDIANKWLCEFEILNIINKDSLEMTSEDRAELLHTIKHSKYSHIIVIHGTDTLHLSSEAIAEAKLKKYIVFTGAMVPYSIEPVEASANLASAYGYLQALEKEGIYIAINAVFGSYKKVQKDRQQGRFILL